MTTITPLAGRAKPAAASAASLGCNARGLSDEQAREVLNNTLEAVAARVCLAHEYLYTGEIDEAKKVLKRLRAVLPEPSSKALACACVESAED